MKGSNRNLLVLFKNAFLDEQALEQELGWLQEILHHSYSPLQFCIANELVNRNRVTSNPKKILKEASYLRLRPFRFLVNKN